MATKKLLELFSKLQQNSKSIYFGDLMRNGYSSPIIKYAIELSGAKLKSCKDGYTVIYFN